MADLAAFQDAHFDPILYINEYCGSRPENETVERYLADLEMRLHLNAEDTSLYLQDHSSKAVTRIPAASKELLRMKDNIAALRADVAAALEQLEIAELGATAAVSTLKDLDKVKRRMEAACTTLKEAAGLSSLFQRVEDLFASGDPARVAEALAGMRRGLAVVGDSVQEFRGGRERLGQLEERFASMVEGSLAAALKAQKGGQVHSLAGMLRAMGKQDLVARLYSSTRLQPLLALWEGHTSADQAFIAWLPGFYNQVLGLLRSECEWCGATLPEQSPALPMALLSTFMSRIDRPFRQRLAGVLAGGAGTLPPLESLQQAQTAALGFAQGVRGLLEEQTPSQGQEHLPDLAAAQLSAVLSQTLAPVEDAVGRYADMEQQYISAQLHQLAVRAVQGSSAASLDTLTSQLADAISPAFAALDAALSRCVTLTAGTALPVLARVLDRLLQQFVVAVQGAVQGMRAQVMGDAQEGGADPSAEAEALLPLLLAADALQQQLAALEAALCAAASAASERLLQQPPEAAAAAGGCDAVAAAQLRLSAQPALRQALLAFAGAASGQGGGILAASSSAVADARGAVAALVLDALLSRVQAQLQAIPSLPDWKAKQSGLPLPSFTPYPLQYITSVGEYLMMLPQLLESSLLGEGEDEEASQLVADWIDKVTLGACQAYLSHLHRLSALSPQGSAQLAADLEYFANVLTTLGVAVPAELAAWQLATGAPPESMDEVAAAASGEGGTAEVAAAVQRVAQLRGVKLPQQQQQQLSQGQ